MIGNESVLWERRMVAWSKWLVRIVYLVNWSAKFSVGGRIEVTFEVIWKGMSSKLESSRNVEQYCEQWLWYCFFWLLLLFPAFTLKLCSQYSLEARNMVSIYMPLSNVPNSLCITKSPSWILSWITRASWKEKHSSVKMPPLLSHSCLPHYNTMSVFI